MSIVKMRKTVRKQIKLRMFGRTFEIGSAASLVFWLFVFIFTVGTYYMYGPGGGGGGGRRAAGAKLTAVVAKVDGHNISRSQYQNRLYYALQMQSSSDISQERRIKQAVLEGIIGDRLKMEAIKAEGISVSRADIERKKDELIEQIINVQYSDKAQLRKVLQDKDMSLAEFKRELRRTRLSDDDALRTQLLFERLQQSVENRVHLNDNELKDSYTEVKARHILIKPESLAEELKAEKEKQQPAADSGKPAANPPKEKAAEEAAQVKQVAEPSEAELEEAARKKLTELRKQIVEQGADFAELAKKYSDGPSAPRGGDLGWFKRGRMDKTFEDVAFKLKPGEVSGIVKTRFGLHLIKVEARRQELPEDFEQKKEQYRQQVTAQRKQQAWAQYQTDLREKANVTIIDPELLAYDLLDKDPKKNAPIAAQHLAAAAKADPTNYSARYELAMLFEQAGETERAVKQLQEITQTKEGQSPSSSPQVYLKLAELLKKQKKTQEALAALGSASENAQAFEFTNYFVHLRAKELFEQMGKPDLAKQEQEWIDDFSEQQSQSRGAGAGTFQVN